MHDPAITHRTTLLQLDTVRILTIAAEEENDNEENVTSYLILLLSLHPNRKSNGTQSDEIEEVWSKHSFDSLFGKSLINIKVKFQQLLIGVDCVKNWGVCACYQILCKRLLYWMCILEVWNYLWRRCNNNFWDMWYELHDTVCLLHLHFVRYSTNLQIFPRII